MSCSLEYWRQQLESLDSRWKTAEGMYIHTEVQQAGAHSLNVCRTKMKCYAAPTQNQPRAGVSRCDAPVCGSGSKDNKTPVRAWSYAHAHLKPLLSKSGTISKGSCLVRGSVREEMCRSMYIHASRLLSDGGGSRRSADAVEQQHWRSNTSTRCTVVKKRRKDRATQLHICVLLVHTPRKAER